MNHRARAAGQFVVLFLVALLLPLGIAPHVHGTAAFERGRLEASSSPPGYSPSIAGRWSFAFDKSSGSSTGVVTSRSGDSLVVFVSVASSAKVVAVTDSAGTAYRPLHFVELGSTLGLAVWTAANVSAVSGDVVAVTLSASSVCAVDVVDVSNASTDPVDGIGPGANGTAVSPPSSSVVTATPGDLLLLGIATTGTPTVDGLDGTNVLASQRSSSSTKSMTGAALDRTEPWTGPLELSAKLSSGETWVATSLAIRSRDPPAAPANPATPTNLTHVVTIVLENAEIGSVYLEAPYMRYLAATYGNDSRYFAACHPSAPNYLALTSGFPWQCGSDALRVYDAVNLPDLLEERGLTWAGYFENMSGPCDTTDNGTYVAHHDPFVYYADIVENRSRCDGHVLPASAWSLAVNSGTLPSYSLYVPNLLDDGSKTSVAYADAWLRGFLSPLLNSTDPTVADTVRHTVFFVLYDEGTTKLGYNGTNGGHVYLTAVAPAYRGVTVTNDSSDSDVLSTVEWLFGLRYSGGNDGTPGYPPISSLFASSQAPPPPTAYPVSGTVGNSSGGALSGASVTATGAGPSVTQRTAASGSYSLDLANGSYTLTAAAAGYTARSPSVAVAGAAVGGVDFVLPPDEFSLGGLVTSSATGAAIAGASVWANDSGGSARAITTVSGNYSFLLANGSYDVTACADGDACANTTAEVVGSAVAGVDLTLRSDTFVVSGYVNSSSPAAPLAGATVWANSTGTSGSTVTGPDGSYAFLLRNGSYTFAASAPGYAVLEAPVVVSGANLGNVDFLLPPDRFRLSGTVNSTSPGGPLAGATVWANLSADARSTLTSASGTFSFLLPNGTYEVTAVASGFVPASTAAVVAGTAVSLPANLTLSPLPASPPPPSGTGPDDWPTYLANAERTSSNSNESALSVLNAKSIRLLWSAAAGKVISGSTIVVGGVAYVGTWGGYLFAFNATTGATIWKSPFLGTTVVCGTTTGVAATPTYSRGTLYVAGGNARFYAVNATTGTIDWDLELGLPSAGYFLWASSLVVGNYAYQGIASGCDKPLVPGALDMIDLSTHAVARQFNTTLDDALGASIWATPTYWAATGTVFVATGNAKNASGAEYAESILALNATTLALEGQWKVPTSQASSDGDFGATPSLFASDRGFEYVADPNKNGILYVWNASDLAAGPVWEHAIAVGYGPIIGGAAYGDGLLFVGTQRALLSGSQVGGTVWAFNATTGLEAWEVSLWGPDLAAPVYSNGLVLVDGGQTFFVLDAHTGAKLFHFKCGSKFFAPPSLSHGIAYLGCSSGTEYAFGVPGVSGVATALAAGSPPLGAALPAPVGPAVALPGVRWTSALVARPIDSSALLAAVAPRPNGLAAPP